MTESIRRSGEYEHSRGNGDQPSAAPRQQHASSPVNPEWPPPPAYDPPRPVAADPANTAWASRTAAHPGPAAYADSAGHGVHGGDTAVLPAVPAQPAPNKRAGGPVALLAVVAIAAAAVGGGTAYAFQELTGTDTAAVGSSGSNVVPSSQRGSIAAIAKAVSPSVVEVRSAFGAGTSTGSGVIVTSDGEILTNNHVVAGASSVRVRTSDGKAYTAGVVGTDSSKDLALIKLKGASGLKAAALGDSGTVQVGDQVVAIGSPEGLTGTVTSGIVSAVDRDVTVPADEDPSRGDQGGGRWPFQFGGREFNGDTGSSTTTYKALQTDASLNPGNSGGALIAANGTVVGINSAMYSAVSDTSSAGAGSVGLGFAIPINTVKADLAELRSGSQS
ncbi:S1C family serine protease [Streptomyces sp. NPDC003697]